MGCDCRRRSDRDPADRLGAAGRLRDGRAAAARVAQAAARVRLLRAHLGGPTGRSRCGSRTGDDERPFSASTAHSRC